jgi:hypothetical protein
MSGGRAADRGVEGRMALRVRNVYLDSLWSVVRLNRVHIYELVVKEEKKDVTPRAPLRMAPWRHYQSQSTIVSSV